MSDVRQKENSLLTAYTRAAQILRIEQSSEICRKTGAVFENSIYKINFIGTDYEIIMPEVRFITPGTITIIEVLILHYLTATDRQTVNGDFISFKGIPGGMFYFKSFQQRVLNKLIENFKDTPENLLKAGEAIGGKKWGIGDYSVAIQVFPRIEMVVQLFPADDEFPPDANILFSDSIVNFLPAEDAAFLGGYLVGNLAGKLRS